ncbi:O-antigen ligase family protein [Gordonia sp. OPL2]|uniref:O-antigen ligase family protein n=1 Tax=Gordonia sp. OPL2 TaxID=2486274 RepID=UPI0016566DB4|nr:O-antigen ligase family protein [Gordonia sp. OPL2]
MGAWSVIAFLLPMYRQLPDAARVLWFAGVFSLIVGSAVFLRLARPLFPGVWLFAGLASAIAVLTATDTATIPENAFVGAQLFAVLGLAVFVMTANVRRSRNFVAAFSLSFLAGQSASSLAGIAQAAGFDVLGIETVQGRAAGLSSHPNVLGLMSSIAILVCLTMLLRGAPQLGTSFARVALGALTVVNVGGLLSTGSLSSMMSAGIGVLVTVAVMRDRIKHFVLAVVATAASLWFVAEFTSVFNTFRSPADRYLQVTGQTTADSTWDIRKLTYEYAWQSIKEAPLFGRGLPAEYGGTYDGITLTHNIFLRAWFQGGVLLAIAVGAIIIAIAVAAIRAVVRKQHGGAAGVLVTIAAFALTSAFFEQPDYWLPAIVAWAAISVDSNGLQPPQRWRQSDVHVGVRESVSTRSKARSAGDLETTN